MAACIYGIRIAYSKLCSSDIKKLGKISFPDLYDKYKQDWFLATDWSLSVETNLCFISEANPKYLYISSAFQIEGKDSSELDVCSEDDSSFDSLCSQVPGLSGLRPKLYLVKVDKMYLENLESKIMK